MNNQDSHCRRATDGEQVTPDYAKANKIQEEISRQDDRRRALQEEFNGLLRAGKDPKATMKEMSECVAKMRSLCDELAKTVTFGWF